MRFRSMDDSLQKALEIVLLIRAEMQKCRDVTDFVQLQSRLNRIGMEFEGLYPTPLTYEEMKTWITEEFAYRKQRLNVK